MNWVEKVWKVEDVMVEDVVTVHRATPYRRLVELLWIHGISGLPVVDDAGHVLGIVSESDLLGRSGNSRRSASDLMTSPVVSVEPATALADAAMEMLSRSLKRLPVVDRSGKLVGIVSRADLLKVFLRSEETLAWDISELVERQLGASSAVDVEISSGVVTLGGPVESREEGERLAQMIGALPGVVAVDNQLRWPVATGM